MLALIKTLFGFAVSNKLKEVGTMIKTVKFTFDSDNFDHSVTACLVIRS